MFTFKSFKRPDGVGSQITVIADETLLMDYANINATEKFLDKLSTRLVNMVIRKHRKQIEKDLASLVKNKTIKNKIAIRVIKEVLKEKNASN